MLPTGTVRPGAPSELRNMREEDTRVESFVSKAQSVEWVPDLGVLAGCCLEIISKIAKQQDTRLEPTVTGLSGHDGH